MISFDEDAALICETHLKQKHASNVIQNDGYTFLRRDRLERRAGGVAVVLRDDWEYQVLDLAGDDRDFELLWVRIGKGSRRWILGAVYHPPKPIYCTDRFMDYLESSMEEIITRFPGHQTAMGGDFNQLSITEISSRTGLIPTNDQPSRGNK